MSDTTSTTMVKISGIQTISERVLLVPAVPTRVQISRDDAAHIQMVFALPDESLGYISFDAQLYAQLDKDGRKAWRDRAAALPVAGTSLSGSAREYVAMGVVKQEGPDGFKGKGQYQLVLPSMVGTEGGDGQLVLPGVALRVVDGVTITTKASYEFPADDEGEEDEGNSDDDLDTAEDND